ncbi:sugar kinase [Alphaproteobacteria bacterium GH1-50]|uniref:Sugar kinase n=1 Tax=Kangsaoukella pontilimi TaxID=2691042 RepID=A0A7C9J3P6_9RHOB|nr:PfkB family carbohydrate kinase [Kangsaoukella pontilimi]MXQ08341.1 sugar kinase [Kangsaoukella pontilimi]
MTDVLIAGVAVADIVMRVAELPRTAEKYRAEDAVVTVGGCAANAAIGVARHGGVARLAARLGGDLVGAMIAQELRQEGVDLSLCNIRPDALSSFSSIYIDGTGERQIMNFRGRNLAPSIDLSEATPAGAVLTDNRWSVLTAEAIAAGRRWSVPAVVDAEAPFDADAVRGASHIVFSMQGLREFEPSLPVDAALERARAEFAAWVAVTDGPKGVRYIAPEGIGHVPSFPVKAVDTLGAGDIWHGVFALRLGMGDDEVAAIRYANAAAALKCARFGGVKSCPDRAQTEALLSEAGEGAT